MVSFLCSFFFLRFSYLFDRQNWRGERENRLYLSNHYPFPKVYIRDIYGNIYKSRFSVSLEPLSYFDGSVLHLPCLLLNKKGLLTNAHKNSSVTLFRWSATQKKKKVSKWLTSLDTGMKTTLSSSGIRTDLKMFTDKAICNFSGLCKTMFGLMFQFWFHREGACSLLVPSVSLQSLG